jgi:glycosyltransferase involved in cell wall biosynthesis
MNDINATDNLPSRALFAALPFSEQAMLAYKGVSPAARRWLLGFLGGLDANEKIVHVFGHQIAPFFPKGPLIPGDSNNIVEYYPALLLRYLNLWPFRWRSLIGSYKSGIDKAVTTWGRFDYVFSYNPWPNQLAMGQYIKSKYPATKWILITLDYEDPDQDFKTFLRITKSVDYYVFLSQWAYDNFPCKNKYLMEGGVRDDIINDRYRARIQALKKNSGRKKPAILYAGMFDIWGGVDLLLKAFETIEDDIELLICGHGNDSLVKAAAAKDNRIKLHGLVSDERLDQLSRDASIFVNPRPVDVDGNLMNFPSKILEYLTYCKPVVSTATPGLLNEYKDVCITVGQDPQSIRAGIIKAISINQDSLLEIANDMFVFLKDKVWSEQVKKLITWVDWEK